MAPSADAITVANAYQAATRNKKLGEVGLFDELIHSLASTGLNRIVTERYHGSAHQVWHDTMPEIDLGRKRCELADVMFLTFHESLAVPPRLTFLQFKYERLAHQIDRPGSNYVQWSLLRGRGPIRGAGKFSPPSNLLSDALFPSIGSFGFFWRDPSRGSDVELRYTSADLLKPSHPTPTGRKYGRLTSLDGAKCSPFVIRSLPYRGCPKAFIEVVRAGSLAEFFDGLFNAWIGSPIVRGMSARSWLSATLQNAPGRLASELRQQLGAPPRNERPGFRDDSFDTNLAVPARSVVIVRSSQDIPSPSDLAAGVRIRPR